MKLILPIVCTVATLLFYVALRWARRRLATPDGCLGCNPKPVTRMLRAHGLDPASFVEMPRPRHAWKDIVPCLRCGRYWLVMPRNPQDGARP